MQAGSASRAEAQGERLLETKMIDEGNEKLSSPHHLHCPPLLCSFCLSLTAQALVRNLHLPTGLLHRLSQQSYMCK